MPYTAFRCHYVVFICAVYGISLYSYKLQLCIHMESSDRQEVEYNRDTPLEGIFRNSVARILDFLILNQDFDYSPAEMSRITGIPLRTVQRAVAHLVSKDLIKENRPIGNTTMYILNLKSPMALALRDCIRTAINQNVDRLIQAKTAK